MLSLLVLAACAADTIVLPPDTPIEDIDLNPRDVERERAKFIMEQQIAGGGTPMEMFPAPTALQRLPFEVHTPTCGEEPSDVAAAAMARAQGGEVQEKIEEAQEGQTELQLEQFLEQQQ